MLHWSVADVIAFFETKDAEAFGQRLAANSVQGPDLLRFTVESLKNEFEF